MMKKLILGGGLAVALFMVFCVSPPLAPSPPEQRRGGALTSTGMDRDTQGANRPGGQPLLRLKSPGKAPPLAVMHAGDQRQRGVLFRSEWAGHSRDSEPPPGRTPIWPAPGPLDEGPWKLTLSSDVPPRTLTIQAFRHLRPSGVPLGKPFWTLDCWIEDFNEKRECQYAISGGALTVPLDPKPRTETYLSVFAAWPDGRRSFYGSAIGTASATWLFHVNSRSGE